MKKYFKLLRFSFCAITLSIIIFIIKINLDVSLIYTIECPTLAIKPNTSHFCRMRNKDNSGLLKKSLAKHNMDFFLKCNPKNITQDYSCLKNCADWRDNAFWVNPDVCLTDRIFKRQHVVYYYTFWQLKNGEKDDFVLRLINLNITSYL